MQNVLNNANTQTLKRTPRPEWLKVRIPSGSGYTEVKNIVQGNELHTVCEEARCPNIAECWQRRTATFMILGDVCTRSCGFCAVKTGRPPFLDTEEPKRVADAIAKMDLKHAVITSVNRDELEDGGSGIFAETILRIRDKSPNCKIEVLIPDFKADKKALQKIIDAAPEILNHNTETIPRLYSMVRPQGNYQWSIGTLKIANEAGMTTKTGIMAGLGETYDEIIAVMKDLRQVDVDIFTVGQYLQPTKTHLPVDRFVHPDEFSSYKEEGLRLGFRHVESGPLVRSSYHADEHV